MPDPNSPELPLPFAACAEEVRRLDTALSDLQSLTSPLQITPLAGREWYELLQRKLIPQLAEQPFIVVAVVGGTNIGKSVVFNHLAGSRISATSPLASGTKHPVCLVPPGFETRFRLESIFNGFTLRQWTDANESLTNCPEHLLFWKSHPDLPPNLLILDSPDIDSDAEINWLRADHIRHCADVLVAVLTQQKYNDAAVKQFFRKAAEEDKAIVVVFNQCLLPEDEPYWPLWLETFTRETGIRPDLLYVTPNDRRSAEANRLPFFERSWPVTAPSPPPAVEPRHLGRDLSEMRFHEIKLRTLRGALQQLFDPATGVSAYIAEIRGSSAAFAEASRLLSMQELARVDNWPVAPVSLLIDYVREWWRAHRHGWTKTVHDVYGTVGAGLLYPFRWARQKITGAPPDPSQAYRESERDVMLQALDALYGELTRLSQLGNDLLRPRLEALLAGASRADLLNQLTVELSAFDLHQELERVVATQMQNFREESPGTFDVFRKLDALAAVARPMTSVVVFLAAGPVGHAFTAPAAHALAASAGHIMADIAGGTGAVVVGEAALSGTAGGLRAIEARFRELQTAFVARRVGWFADFLQRHILGNLHTELQAAGGIGQSQTFSAVATSLEKLRQLTQM
ncbi:MAG: GTPase domain-containing protein [Planctomycetes bacterium]|nr:GTPase domain-containing protein [Planctomycetota bacterium]